MTDSTSPQEDAYIHMWMLEGGIRGFSDAISLSEAKEEQAWIQEHGAVGRKSTCSWIVPAAALGTPLTPPKEDPPEKGERDFHVYSTVTTTYVAVVKARSESHAEAKWKDAVRYGKGEINQNHVDVSATEFGWVEDLNDLVVP